MNKLQKILMTLNEGDESDAYLSLLKSTGLTTFSKPQELTIENLNIFSDYINSKIEKMYNLCDIRNTIRVYYIEIKGDITKTLIKDMLSSLDRNIRLPIVFIENKFYMLIRNRVGRGKFEKDYVFGSIKDFKKLSINSNNPVEIENILKNKLNYNKKF